MFENTINWLLTPLSIYNDGLRFRDMEEKHGNLEDRLQLADKLEPVIDRLSKMDSAIEELKVSKKEMVENARLNYSNNKALSDWKHAKLNPIKRDLEYNKRELELVRSAGFNIAVNVVIESDPKIQKIPFIYYNIDSQEIISTKRALDFLEIDEKIDRASLREMLDYVRKEDRTKIIDSIKNSNELKDQIAFSKDGSKELKLNTHNFDYDGTTFGVGISLYSPGIFGAKARFHFYKQLDNVRSLVIKRFDELKYRAKEVTDKPGLENFGYI